MIRRDTREGLLLIPQAQRSQLANTLAARVGNKVFPKLDPSLIIAAAHLDAGWDEAVASARSDNAAPLIETELPRQMLMDFWEASSRRAAQVDAYAGLLVGLNIFWRSIQAGASIGSQWRGDDPRVRFDLNRFQHTMIELLESLRQACGLRIDRPLKYGLAENSRDARERKLRVDFEWVQFLDRLSEAVCSGVAPNELAVPFRGLAKTTAVTLKMTDYRVQLNPWPFDQSRLRLAIQAHALPTGAAQIGAAPGFNFAIELEPLTI